MEGEKPTDETGEDEEEKEKPEDETEVGYCKGEITSHDERCGKVKTKEECNSFGKNALSDGICDWIEGEKPTDETEDEEETEKPEDETEVGYCKGEITSHDERCG